MIRTPSRRTPPGTCRAGSVLRGQLLLAAVAAGLVLSGCVSERAVDVTPAAGPASPPSEPGPAPSAEESAATAPETAAPPAVGVALPLDCLGLLDEEEVAAALGRPLPGRRQDVLGGPDPQIGRIERLTCFYGLADPPGAVPVELSVSRYETPDAAQARVAATVTSETAGGAATEPVVVGTAAGTVLRDADTRLLVAATTDRSVAVSLAADVVDEARVTPVLTDLAARTVSALG